MNNSILHLVLGCYLGDMSSLVSHEVDSIETLYVGAIYSSVIEYDLQDKFYAYG